MTIIEAYRPGLPEPPVSEALNDYEMGILIELLTREPEQTEPVLADVCRLLVPRLVNEVLFHRAASDLSAQ